MCYIYPDNSADYEVINGVNYTKCDLKVTVRRPDYWKIELPS